MSSLDWLRRWLGESAELAALREEHARVTASLIARTTEREEDRAAAAALVRAADKAVREAYEPAAEGCDKVRLRDVDEATTFAVKVELDLSLDQGAMVPYQCKVCPRHPLTGARYWHVGNRNPERRTGRNPALRRKEAAARARNAAQNGQLVKQRLDPAVVARLRAIGPQGRAS